MVQQNNNTNNIRNIQINSLENRINNSKLNNIQLLFKLKKPITVIFQTLQRILIFIVQEFHRDVSMTLKVPIYFTTD